jgi:Mg/Co/Ni transporter MgtE
MQPVAGSQLLGSMSPVVGASALQQLDPSQSQAMLNLVDERTASNLLGSGGMNEVVANGVEIGMVDLARLDEDELLHWMDSLSGDELSHLSGNARFVELIETLVRTNKAKMAVEILSRVPPEPSSVIFRDMDTLLVAELVQFMHPIEATVALGSMENESIANVFTLLPESVLNSILIRLPVSQIADVFDHMDSPKVAHYLVSEEHSLNVADVVSYMEPDRAALALQVMDPHVAATIIEREMPHVALPIVELMNERVRNAIFGNLPSTKFAEIVMEAVPILSEHSIFMCKDSIENIISYCGANSKEYQRSCCGFVNILNQEECYCAQNTEQDILHQNLDAVLQYASMGCTVPVQHGNLCDSFSRASMLLNRLDAPQVAQFVGTSMSPYVSAQVLNVLEEGHAASVIGSLDIPVAASILDYSESEFVASTILRTPVEKLPALMNEMDAGKIAQSLSLLSNSERTQILQLLPPEKAALVSDQMNSYTPGAFTSSPETYTGNLESFAGRPESAYNPGAYAGRPESAYDPGAYVGRPESFAGRPNIDNRSCLSIIERIDSSINGQLRSDSTQYVISGYVQGAEGLPLSLDGLSMFLELSQWVSGNSKSWFEASPQDFQVSCVGAAVYDLRDNSLQKKICPQLSYTMHPKYLQLTFESVDICPTCVLGGEEKELLVISHKDILPLDFRPPVFTNWTCISGTANPPGSFDRFAGGNKSYFDVEDPSLSENALAQDSNNVGLQNSKFGSLPNSLNSQRMDQLKQLPFESLRNAFPDLPSSTKGELLSGLDNEAILILLQSESPEEIALVLAYLDTVTASTALSNLDPRTVSDVLKKVSPARTSDILAMMRPETIASILAVMPDDPWMAEKVMNSKNDTMMHALGNLVPAATTSEILAGMSKEDLESFFASMKPVDAMVFLLKLEKDIAARVINDLQSYLPGLVQSMDRNTIRETFGMSDPVVVALVLQVVPPESKVAIVSNVSPLQASFILQQLENEGILQIFKEMPTEDVAAIIDAIDVELAPSLLELLPREDSARILNILPSRSALRLAQNIPLPTIKSLAPLLHAEKVDLILQYASPAEAAVVISTLEPATIESLHSRNPRLMENIMQSLSEEDSQRIRDILKLNKMIALISDGENCETNEATVLLRSKLDSREQNYLITGSIQNQGSQEINLEGLAITIDLSSWHEDVEGNWQSDGALDYQVDCKYILNSGEGTNNLCQNLIVEVISNSAIVTFKDVELCPSCSLTGGPDGILFEISRSGNTLDSSNMPVVPEEMICLSNLIQNMQGQGMDPSKAKNDGSCNVASALQSTIEFLPAGNYTVYNLAGELTQTSPTTVSLDGVALSSSFNGWAQSSEHVWSQQSPEDFTVECVGIIMLDTQTNSSVDLCPFLQPYISRELFLLSFESGVELCPTCVVKGLNDSALVRLTHKENLVMDFAMDHQLLSPECYADIEDVETLAMLNDNLAETPEGEGNPDLASASSAGRPGTSGTPVVPIEYIDASQLSISLSNDSQRYDVGGSIKQSSGEDGLLDMTITMEFSPWTRANGSTEWTNSPPDQFVVDCNKEAQNGNAQFCDQLQVSITATNESVVAGIDLGNVMLCGDCAIGEPGSSTPLFSLRHVDGAMMDFRQPLIGYAPSTLLHQPLEGENDSWMMVASPSGDEINPPQNDTNT